MDIFEFAIQKEQLSEGYYRQLSRRAANKGLANVFTMLAEEEKKHVYVVKQMQQQTLDTIADVDVLGSAQAVFDSMRDSVERFNFDISQLQLYEKARDIEKESLKFYKQKAREVVDAGQKEIFDRLADEEQRHLTLIQEICDFVAKPQWFLESAEMYHFDDYVEGPL